MAKRRVIANQRGAKVKLEGQEFHVVYDLNALDLFLELSGVNLLFGWPAEKFTPRAVINFVFAGLQRFHEEKVDYKWLGQVIDYENYEEVLEQFKVALKKADAGPTEKKADEGNA